MEDQYNLIYNGKMLHGMDGYATSAGGTVLSMDTTDKPSGCAGSIVLNGGQTNYIGYLPLMPYINTDDYKLSFQYKDVGSTAGTLYICLLPFDNRGVFINSVETYLYEPNGNTVTTLAQDLKDGDTTVYLTDVSKWVTVYTYHQLGIIESAAWKDDKMLCGKYIVKDSINTTTNTLTLQSAWSGGTYKAGSKVREFCSTDTYAYPIRWSDKPTTWTSKETTFTKNAAFSAGRLAFTYFLGFGTLYIKGKLADLRLENLSRPQARIPMNLQNEFPVANIAPYAESTSSVNRCGQLNTGMLSEGFLPVRYIRDWASTTGDGTGAQAYTHWKEIQAFDRWGRNVAFAADGNWSATIYKDGAINSSRAGLNISNTTTYKPLHVITNEVLDDTAYIESSNTTQGNPRSVTIDMGIIHYIDKIIVWHDSQNSNQWHDTKTEVSADGVNWITVFDSAIEGEYQETSAGHTITFDKLGTLYHASMKKGGEILVQDIIED